MFASGPVGPGLIDLDLLFESDIGNLGSDTTDRSAGTPVSLSAASGE